VDPCSAWTAKANKRVQFGYGLHYLIDIESAVIVDVKATPARTYDELAAWLHRPKPANVKKVLANSVSRCCINSLAIGGEGDMPRPR
jgi:hypothetical protein